MTNDCELLCLPDNSKHENTNHHELQTIDFRLLFFLASTAKFMSTVKTGTSLLQAINEWHKTIQHDITIWHSQDMAYTNMKNTIYLIIQDLSRITISKNYPYNMGPLGSWRDNVRKGVDMKWYDYTKFNMEINYSLLKEKGNCRLKVWTIYVRGEIFNIHGYNRSEVVCLQLLCMPQARRSFFLGEPEICETKTSTTV